MGTDIHFYVEKKTASGWESADEWEYNSNYNYWEVPYKKQFYCDRNYSLFAALADVRNGRGFAGVVTGERICPISEPRGLPEDLSKTLTERLDVDHTPSWLTLEEILAYDWTTSVIKYGVVPLETYVEWKKRYEYKECSPSVCYGDITGPRVKIISETEVAEYLNTKDKSSIHVRAKWSLPLYSLCSEFLSETIPKMLRLGKPNEVRAVFYFDS